MTKLLNQDRLQAIWEDSELWSCMGYEGLSIAFNVPVACLDGITELEKKALMRLLQRLITPDEELRNQVQDVGTLSAEERFSFLRDLSSKFCE